MAFRTQLLAGDIGDIVHMHGILYAREHGWDHRFEAYVAESLARFALQHDPARERIWLLDGDERIAGCVGVVAAAPGSAQLRWFLLKPEFRGRGFGKAMLSAAVEFARRADYHEVFLWTVRGLDAAAALYARAGFRLAEAKPASRWGADELIEEKWALVFAPDPK